MRNMSFMLTTEQVRNRTKTVTRRLGWKNLVPGQLVQAVTKGQGLKKGEHPEKLCVIKIVSIRSEFVNHLIWYEYDNRKEMAPYSEAQAIDECRREGFPNMKPREFVYMFCEHNNCLETAVIQRIEFSYV